MIKTKKITIAVDPDNDTSADVSLLTVKQDQEDTIRDGTSKLIISGPGEFEVGGVLIKTRKLGERLICQLYSQGGNILLLSSSVSEELKEEDEDKNAVVIHLDSKLDDRVFSKFGSRLFILYGDAAFLPFVNESLARLPRVNLSRHNVGTDDQKDSQEKIIFLTKN